MKAVDYIVDIQNRVRNKRVLDVGCLATNRKNILTRHKLYCKYSKEAIGVDYNKEFLEIARKNGGKNLFFLDMINNDQVEKFKKRFGTFDHVIATDIIEHIGNLTLFLDNVKKLLNPKGNLYLTTPNALCPNWIFWAIEGDGRTKVNPDHVCYFDVQTLTTLLGRSGLKIKETMFQKTATDRVRKLGMKPKVWMGKRVYIIATRG